MEHDWILIGVESGAAGIILKIGIQMLRKLDRFLMLMKEYPPHRHVPGIIEPIYPKGLNPER